MFFSKEGLAIKKEKLKNLKKDLTDLGIYKGQTAINSGDAWHDNTDFEQTEVEERRLQRECDDLALLIREAIILEPENHNNYVTLNSVVVLEIIFEGSAKEEIKLTVCDMNPEMKSNIVTISSPLGKCIFKQKVGFEGTYKVNTKEIKFKIISIT